MLLVATAMGAKHFRILARVSSSSPGAVKPVLEKLVGKRSVKEANGEFVVETEMEGESAKDPQPLPSFCAEKGREEDEAARRVDLGRRDDRALLRLRLEEDDPSRPVALKILAVVVRGMGGDSARCLMDAGPRAFDPSRVDIP